MSLSSSQVGSPDWVECKLRLFFDWLFSRLIKWISQFEPLVAFFISLISILIFYFRPEIIAILGPGVTQARSQSLMSTHIIWPFFFLYGFNLFFWLIRNQSVVLKSCLASFIVAGFFLTYAPSIAMGVRHLGVLIIFYLGLIIPLFIMPQKTFRFRMSYLTIVFSVMLMTFIYIVYKLAFAEMRSMLPFSNFFRDFLPLSIFLVEQYAGGEVFSFSNKTATSYLFSPIMLVGHTPIRSEYLKNTTYSFSTMIKGFIDTLLALVALLGCTLVYKIFNLLSISNGTLVGDLLVGLKMSLVFFLSSFSYFRISVGMVRFCGFSVPDATEYALLAVSPSESWRRWSIYMYEWMKYFIFIPILRKTNSLMLGILAVFFSLYFIHFFTHLSILFRWNFSFMGWPWEITNRILFFLLQGLAVYISILFVNRWPKANRISGWWGVFITQFLLAIIHILVD